MSLFTNPDQILLLRDLLKGPDAPSSDSEDDNAICNKARNFGPGNIGNKSSGKSTKKPTIGRDKKTEKVPLLQNDKTVESKGSSTRITEVEQWLEQQEKEDSMLLENRKRPEYTVSYKQAVGTQDLYLQMGNRTAATSSCEDIIIEINLSDETVSIAEMNLLVAEDEIDLQTPVYRLKLPLMHKIDPDKGNAKYDSDSKTMTLTLRMIRELDYVNF